MKNEKQKMKNETETKKNKRNKINEIILDITKIS